MDFDKPFALLKHGDYSLGFPTILELKDPQNYQLFFVDAMETAFPVIFTAAYSSLQPLGPRHYEHLVLVLRLLRSRQDLPRTGEITNRSNWLPASLLFLNR